MIFEVEMSIRNCILRSKQSVKKIIIISTSILLLFLCIGLIKGTGKQMFDCLNNYQGDICIQSRYSESDISDIYDDINNNIDVNAFVCKESFESIVLSSDNGYSIATVRGIENLYIEKFEKTIGWTNEKKTQLNRGECFIDVQTSALLKVKEGDYLTIQYSADDGFMNTLQVIIGGIFIGNQYLYDKVVFVNIEDMTDLFLEEIVNCVKVYITDNISDVELHNISNSYEKKYFERADVTTRTDYKNTDTYSMFFYYRIFLIVIIILIILLIIILISLSIKHIYFMEFRNRRHEISTQMAFGMDSKSMILIVFFETFFLFIVSTFIAIILYFILQVLLGLFTITSLNYQDFVALLGGNKIVISCPLVWGIVSSIVIFLILICSSISGTKKYLVMHVKDIISSE